MEAVDETVAPEAIGSSRFINSILEEASTWVGDEQAEVLGITSGARSGLSTKSQSTHDQDSAPTVTGTSDASNTLFWDKSDTVMVRLEQQPRASFLLHTLLTRRSVVRFSDRRRRASTRLKSLPRSLTLTLAPPPSSLNL
jgi:hypothetical protein